MILKQIKSEIRTYLNKLKFELGFSPIIDKSNKESSFFIPTGYESVCLISADFELAWAFRFSKSASDPIKRANALGVKTRENVPKILQLCEEYNIPITWATIGHLFLHKCKRINGLPHPDIKRLPPFENEFWKYSNGDWFKDDPCTDYLSDPAWYCPDLINEILNSPVKHEIGCHTFSHIDCRDSVCSDEVFLSEIKACKVGAKSFNIDLKSFVHPGHQIGNLQNLFNEGFTSFRTDYRDTLSTPKKHASGLWELKNTAIIDYRKSWSVKYHIYRYRAIIKRAIKNKKVCILWFHPSFNSIMPDKVLPEIFSFLHEHNDRIWITTHHEYTNWLNKNHKKPHNGS